MKPQSARELALLPAPAVRIQACVLGLCILLSRNALAFNYPLQPEEVREAYSLGQTSNHEELNHFYSQYEHHFRYPADNPIVYVESVELRTPYEQIVLRSQQGTRYSAFQADEDYRANPGAVIVRFVISYKLNYVGELPPIDTFKFLISGAQSIEPQKITNAVICNPAVDGAACVTLKREVLLWFNAEQFAPGAVKVKVETPDGQTIRAKFDLDKLK